MAFFQFPHPWDPRYALPGNVRTEPPGRGTLVTKGLRRGTIDTVRTPRGKWAVPGYVMSESGQGAIVTKGLPRRFVDAKAPDYLAKSKIITRRPSVKRAGIKVGRGSLSGTVFDGSTLGGFASRRRARRSPFSGLGDLWDVEHEPTVVTVLGVPFHLYKFRLPIGGWTFMAITKNGRPTASVLKSNVPKELAEKINSAITKKATELLKANPSLAQTPAVLLDQAKRAIGLVGDSEFYRKSIDQLTKIGASDLAKAAQHLVVGKVTSLDGVDVFGKNWIFQVEEIDGKYYHLTIFVTSDPSPLGQLAFLIAKPLEIIIKAGIDVTKYGAEAALKALDKIMQTACAAAKSDLAPLTGAAVSTAYGAPPQVGAQAVQIVASVCGQKPVAPPPMAIPSKLPILPIAIAGAGVLLIIMGMRE